MYPLESSASAFPYGHQPQQGPNLQNGLTNGTENPLEAALRRNLSMQLPALDGFCDSASQVFAIFFKSATKTSYVHTKTSKTLLFRSLILCYKQFQLATFWEDDLQSVVQMGFGQNQPQTSHGTTITLAKISGFVLLLGTVKVFITYTPFICYVYRNAYKPHES